MPTAVSIGQSYLVRSHFPIVSPVCCCSFVFVFWFDGWWSFLFFQGMEQRWGVKPNLYHYTSLVTCLLKAGQWSEAIAMTDRMEVCSMFALLQGTTGCIHAKEDARPLSPWLRFCTFGLSQHNLKRQPRV